jgi:hypothetical protein
VTSRKARWLRRRINRMARERTDLDPIFRLTAADSRAALWRLWHKGGDLRRFVEGRRP